MKEEFQLGYPISGMPDLRDAAARRHENGSSSGTQSLIAVGLAIGVLVVARLLGKSFGWGEEGIVKLSGILCFLVLFGVMGFFIWLDERRWPDTVASWPYACLLIGADGVLLSQAWRKHPNEPPKVNHRFLPYSAIKQIEKFLYMHRGSEGPDYDDEGVVLTLESGQYFSLHLVENGKTDDLYRRFCEERDRCGQIVSTDAALFQRGDQSAEDWLDALDMLGLSSHEGYRAPAISSERLWLVIDAPSANPTARAGAAFALSKRADVVDHERLLNTAKSAVAPGLDAALEAIANASSEEALANALAAVEEPALEAR